ncbi:MAG: 3-oxo-tetronate kinase [Hyphomicrobiales bacterium]
MLVGCIADDFTGATDLANVLTRQGMRCIQLNGLSACNPANVQEAKSHDGVVVALKTRSIPATNAVSQSLKALSWLREQGADKFFFKYCSTFDSTDDGNIGPVAEALMDSLGTDMTIACPAAPENVRTVYQGHLFVGGKLLSETGMRHHPITPMTDPNLVDVLARQSRSKVGLVSFTEVAAGPDAVRKRLQSNKKDACRLAIADALTDEHLRTLAEAGFDMPLMTGGSGLAIGLPDLFRARGLLQSETQPIDWPKISAGLVISGSCSEATNAQVAAFKARASAWKIEPQQLATDKDGVVRSALSFIAEKRRSPCLVYSTTTPEALTNAQSELGQETASGLIEQAMGEIACGAVEAGVRKLVVAGGETSGAVVSALGIETLTIGPEIAPGVPWTLGNSNPPIALALKSGNFGAPDFFSTAFEVLP